MQSQSIFKPKGNFKFQALVPFFLYVVVYFALIFKGVYVRGDDFAYVESVVQSLTTGSLITHDWIGPYNAFFTLTGVITYLITKNFYLSTYGMLSLFALVNYWLFFLWFQKKTSAVQAGWYAFIVVTFPFYLHKSLDYHGCVPTLTCFLIAILAYESQKFAVMFIAIFLAVSTRQNSLFLLILPARLVFEMDRREGKIFWKIGAYTILFFGALILLRLHLNTNWFNRSFHPLENVTSNPLSIIRNFTIGIFLGIFFLSLANLFVGRGNVKILLKENFRHFLLPTLLSILFFGVAFGSPAALVWFQTPLIGSLDHTGRLQLALKILVLISFWFLDRSLLKITAPILLGIGYVLISCLRGFYWDYYLAELALIALWISLQALKIRIEVTEVRMKITRIVFAFIILFNLSYAYLYKLHLDKQALSDIVFERLERRGLVSPQTMTGATFGYLGYKLCGLLSEENPHFEKDDFTCYVQGNGVILESALPWRRQLSKIVSTENERKNDILDSGFYLIGFVKLPYRVVDHKNPEGKNICHEEFRFDGRTKSHSRPFPLNNREWSHWIKHQTFGALPVE